MEYSVKEIRQYTGMTQAEFAAEIGVSAVQLKRYEKGGTLPKNEAVLRNLTALIPSNGIPKNPGRRAGLAMPSPDSWQTSLVPHRGAERTQHQDPNSEEGRFPGEAAKMTRAARKEKWLWQGYKARFISKQQYILLGGLYFSESTSE